VWWFGGGATAAVGGGCGLALICTCDLPCCSYGETSWFWEVEELLRKLLLTAVAVLLDAGSPLQVCLLSLSCPGPPIPCHPATPSLDSVATPCFP
jgi:hypothetical protein